MQNALHASPNNRSEEHTSELQSPCNLVCRLLLEKKKKTKIHQSERLQTAHLSLPQTTSTHRCVGILRHRDLVSFVRLDLLTFFFFFFFFNDTATTEIYTLSLHDALPI